MQDGQSRAEGQRMGYKSNRSFDILMEDGTNGGQKKIDFKFDKMLSVNNVRKAPRKLATGHVYIYNESGEVIGKSDLVDASVTGLRIKMTTANFTPGDSIIVVIASAGTKFEPVRCNVKWLADIGLQFKQKHLGLAFDEITADFKAKFAKQMDLKNAV